MLKILVLGFTFGFGFAWGVGAARTLADLIKDAVGR